MNRVIAVTLEADESLEDPSHEMGLTTEGYEALASALSSAGFSIVDGPEAQVV